MDTASDFDYGTVHPWTVWSPAGRGLDFHNNHRLVSHCTVIGLALPIPGTWKIRVTEGLLLDSAIITRK